MNIRLSHLVLSLATTLAAPAAAQVHTRTELVLGQNAAFGVTAAPPGAFVLMGLGATGLGARTCFPAPFSLCLGILEPVVYFPVLQADATGAASLPAVIPPNLPLVSVATQAIVIDVGVGFVASTTNAIDEPILPLSAWSDDFAGAQLDPSWSIHNPHLLAHSVSGGELHVQPTQAGPAVTWYADGEGPLIYKLVRGDFDVRTAVRSYLPGNPSQPPPLTFRMGGISLRDPASGPGQRNWAHIAVGAGTPAVPIAVEDKNTIDSNSDLRLTPLTASAAEIRAVRQGVNITFYYREASAGPWTALRTFARPDLPPTLQVGLMVYSWDAPNTVQASYRYLRFVDP